VYPTPGVTPVRLRSSILTIALFLLVALAVVLLLMHAGPALTDPAAGPSPSVAPSASPTTAPTPAAAQLKAWVRRWHAADLRAFRLLRRARACWGMCAPKRPGSVPGASRAATAWKSVGARFKAQALAYRVTFGRLWRHMNNPGGSGEHRWRALVRWIWPARCVETVLGIMHYESGGNPRVLCGGYVLPKGDGDGKPDSRAGGLMQLKPAPRHWADPYYNLWYAYHYKYTVAGWSPWAGDAAVP